MSRGTLASDKGFVVRSAAQAGVELLALTDHDSVDGVDEAVQAASEHGIGLVSAVEISALDRGGRGIRRNRYRQGGYGPQPGHRAGLARTP